MRYFGMTPEYVEHGPDGNGIPWDWWIAGKAYIEAMTSPTNQ